MKTCNKCGCRLPLSAFCHDRCIKGSGLRSICRECSNTAGRNYRTVHRSSVRNSKLKKLYGITANDYSALLIQQKSVCAICKEQCKTGRYLAVDHDHKTGKVRGLLCVRCNNAIGFLKDSITLLRNAADYLEQYLRN
jgi:hypothetical protein